MRARSIGISHQMTNGFLSVAQHNFFVRQDNDSHPFHIGITSMQQNNKSYGRKEITGKKKMEISAIRWHPSPSSSTALLCCPLRARVLIQFLIPSPSAALPSGF